MSFSYQEREILKQPTHLQQINDLTICIIDF